MASIDLTCRDGVATVTLTAPERRNALDAQMVTELVDAFDTLEADESVHAVVVTGAPPAFCAGADLSDLLHASSSDEDAARSGLLQIYEGFLRVSRCPLPTLAAVNGAAVGAGVNLALACDVRLVARSARIDTRFVQLGLHPGGGHTWMLQRLAGPQTAAAALLFGEVLTAEEAVRVGVAWRVVEDDLLLDVASELAARTAAAPRRVLIDVKATLGDMPAVATHALAVERELGPQVWSISQPEARARLTTRRAR